jgi:uncharacterized protein YpmS
MRFTRKQWLLIISFVLISASLACHFPEQGLPSTSIPIPVKTEALQNPQVNIQTPGHVSLTIDEAELTSLVASEIQKQQDPVLQDPKVTLRDGFLKINGKVQQAGITADLEIKLTISATQDGHLAFQLVSAQLGPFPLSQDLNDSISKQLDSALAGNIDPRFENVFIESVTIANGQMVIQGHPR